jgi:hypothetical protein
MVEVLKWVGYTLAAIAVLTLIATLGTVVVGVVLIGGVIISVVGLVVFIAAVIKGHFES